MNPSIPLRSFFSSLPVYVLYVQLAVSSVYFFGVVFPLRASLFSTCLSCYDYYRGFPRLTILNKYFFLATLCHSVRFFFLLAFPLRLYKVFPPVYLISQWLRSIKTLRPFVSNFAARAVYAPHLISSSSLSFSTARVSRPPSFDLARCHLATFSPFIPFQVTAYIALNCRLSMSYFFPQSVSVPQFTLFKKCHLSRLPCFARPLSSSALFLHIQSCFPVCSFTVGIMYSSSPCTFTSVTFRFPHFSCPL